MPQDSQIKRRIIDFHKFKIVMITGILGWKLKDVITGAVPLIKLPAGYPLSRIPMYGIINGSTDKGYTKWGMTDDGQSINLAENNTDVDLAAHPDYIVWLPVNIWYISD